MTSEKARPCPLCGGDGDGETYPYGTRWEGKLFRNLRCARCASSFLDPVPTEAELERMYDRSAYHDENYPLEAEDTQTSEIGSIIACLPAGGSMLDFGCGNGHFLKLASAMGFAAQGVEIDRATCAMAEANSGCEVLTRADFVARAERRYAIIHLGDVLEHLPDPAATMRLLESRLMPGGRFFIEGPLEDNFSVVNAASRTYGRVVRTAGRDYGWYLPLHLFRANAKAQRRFFTDRLDYRLHVWRQDDDGWPYRDRHDNLLRPRSAAHALKMAIAGTSRLVTRAALAVGVNSGNRFATVVSPREDAPAK